MSPVCQILPFQDRDQFLLLQHLRSFALADAWLVQSELAATLQSFHGQFLRDLSALLKAGLTRGTYPSVAFSNVS